MQDYPRQGIRLGRRAAQADRERVSLAKAEFARELGREFSTLTLKRFLTNGCRFKRVRREVKRKPNADVYEFKKEFLAELERLGEQGRIDLFCGDESRAFLQPCVPYGWQCADERVTTPSARGCGVNCFALLLRDNRVHAGMTGETIASVSISERLDALSFSLKRATVVVLDNARVRPKAVSERRASGGSGTCSRSSCRHTVRI